MSKKNFRITNKMFMPEKFENFNKTFSKFDTEVKNQTIGSMYKLSPRSGAGSLGPNYA